LLGALLRLAGEEPRVREIGVFPERFARSGDIVKLGGLLAAGAAFGSVDACGIALETDALGIALESL